jgi:hypothetical protein
VNPVEPRPEAHPQPGWFEYLPLAVSASAVALVAVALTARLGGTPDSIEYLFSARSLLAGDGFRTIYGHPFIQYAPLFPLVIAAVSKTGVDVLTAARLVSVVTLSTSAVVAGLWTRRITRDWVSMAFGGMIAVLVAPALLTRFVWSESLFISLVLGAGLCLTVALQTRSLRWLVVAGSLTGLAAATRWAGLPLLVIVLYVAYAWSGTWRTRMAASLAFGLPSVLVGATPLLRNMTVADSTLPATPDPGRSIGQVSREAASGVSSWFGLPGTPWPLRVLGLVALLAAFLWAVRTLCGRRSAEWWRSVIVPFLFGGVYLITNILSALSTSIGSLTDRMLTPCYPLFVVGMTGVIWSAGSHVVSHWPSTRRRAAVNALVAGPPALLFVVALGAVLHDGTDLRPREHLSRAVIESAVLNGAARYPESQLVSNNPVDAAWVTGRPVTAAPNPGSEMHKLEALVRKGPTVLAWTSAQEVGHVVPLDGIARACTLTQLSRYDDGTLYRVESCRRLP